MFRLQTPNLGQGVLVAALALAALVALARPAAGQAAQVSITDSTLVFRAEPGETNLVTISNGGPGYLVRDTGAPLSALAPCVAITMSEAFCPGAGVIARNVVLGDGNDTFATTVHAVVFAGEGDDEVTVAPGSLSLGSLLDGGAGDDELTGGRGPDQLLGGPDDDRLFGGDGRDRLDGGSGADLMHGQNGVDEADYSTRTTRVIVDLDGRDDDGGPLFLTRLPERDNVMPDVENVRGGASNDRLTGSDDPARANILWGGAGNDILRGLRGPDTLDGGAGNDSLSGGAGPGIDRVVYPRTERVVVTIDFVANDGEPGLTERDNVSIDVEAVSGGDGNDHITGRSWDTDILSGGRGNDTLRGLGGNDVLRGGLGTDKVFGGDGNDSLDENNLFAVDDPSPDNDLLNGGAGVDTVTYSERSSSVQVILDSLANDGFAGEHDRTTRVENVIGGRGSDRIRGDAGPNRLEGRAGNDWLRGGGGNDSLLGGSGFDVCDLGPGGGTALDCEA